MTLTLPTQNLNTDCQGVNKIALYLQHVYIKASVALNITEYHHRLPSPAELVVITHTQTGSRGYPC